MLELPRLAFVTHANCRPPSALKAHRPVTFSVSAKSRKWTFLVLMKSFVSAKKFAFVPILTFTRRNWFWAQPLTTLRSMLTSPTTKRLACTLKKATTWSGSLTLVTQMTVLNAKARPSKLARPSCFATLRPPNIWLPTPQGPSRMTSALNMKSLHTPSTLSTRHRTCTLRKLAH